MASHRASVENHDEESPSLFGDHVQGDADCRHSTSYPLFRRQDDNDDDDTTDSGHRRGRHLVAACPISRGRLIFAERPLLFQQSLDNVTKAWTCQHCYAFVGGPDQALKHRQDQHELHTKRQQVQQTEAATVNQNGIKFPQTSLRDDTRDKERANVSVETSDDEYWFPVVPCRCQCGMVFCSRACEVDAWSHYHAWLCTGPIDDLTHPLIQFKQFAVKTNEILLLVAEWWVAEHVALAHMEAAAATGGTDSQSLQLYPSVSPYQDFLMNPWWEVATLEYATELGGFAKAAVLQHQLQQICTQAAALLQQALELTSSNANPLGFGSVVGLHPTNVHFPPITALDVARRVGACEQNAMGVRQRHPLCRDIFDRGLRERCHDQVVFWLAQSGYIGGSGGVDNEKDLEDTAIDDAEDLGRYSGNAVPNEDSEDGSVDDEACKEECEDDTADAANIDPSDFTVEEISTFLVGLKFDEEGSVRDRALDPPDKQETPEGDDLDYIFPPLDGTAMYAAACKMNHSCDPTVILLYKRTRWGFKHPLTAYCIARRDIMAGEELTISYIAADQPYDHRQASLKSYGFTCQCRKCMLEAEHGVDAEPSNPEDETDKLFGNSSEGSGSSAGDLQDLSIPSHDDADGETRLQNCLARLDTMSNHIFFGSVPPHLIGAVGSFIMQTAKLVVPSLTPTESELCRLLEHCALAIQERDFTMGKIVGVDLEVTLFGMLQNQCAWTCIAHRQAYWCGTLTAALGLSHECRFWAAQNILDKAVILGLPSTNKQLCEFLSYVTGHAAQVAIGPYPAAVASAVPDYQSPEYIKHLQTYGLSRSICCPINETSIISESSDIWKLAKESKPFVMRDFAKGWPAIHKWRHLQYFATKHGHRLIPVEIGSMMDNSMSEQIMTLRALVEHIISTEDGRDCWSLDDAVNRAASVIYLAQHPLLEQIPSLLNDVIPRPALCGMNGPSNVYCWFGSGGTRTPLHFDSHNNLFVQIVGAKYLRLYSQSETDRLYRSAGSRYGLQGNMSEIDCEHEDWSKHVNAKTAAYEEVLLLPGDSLYIPAGTWHYVRSLKASISVNYWF